MKASSLKPIGAKASGRRKLTLALREGQLKIGKKRNRGTTQQKKDDPYIPLTKKDISRIEKEIVVLKSRIQ